MNERPARRSAFRPLGLALIAVALTGCFYKSPPESAFTSRQDSFVDTESKRTSGGNVMDTRSVIRSASLGLKVKDLDLAKESVETIVATNGGRTDAWSLNEDRYLSMRLRIPEPRLEDVMEQIAGLGKVTERSLHSADVTDQVIDLEARLANLVALRDRLRGYLGKTTDLKEILEVEKELARVQTDIEIYQRKLDLLKAQIALSELSLMIRRR